LGICDAIAVLTNDSTMYDVQCTQRMGPMMAIADMIKHAKIRSRDVNTTIINDKNNVPRIEQRA
jgi:hypothetical protein